MDLSLISCRFSSSAATYQPLGPLYVAAAVERCGWKAEIIDFQQRPGSHLFDVEGLVATLANTKAEVVGLSLFGDALPLVLAALRRYARSHGTGRVFILGGPGVNGNETHILERYPEVYALIRGEGETTLPLLLQAYYDGLPPRGAGIYARDAAGQPVGEPPTRIENIDGLSWPAYEMLDVKSYEKLSVVTSRGCPFDCSFCEIIAMWGRTVSYRTIDDVIGELEALVARTGRRTFDIIDDTFTVRKKRVLALCRALERADLDLGWTCFSRVDLLDEETTEAMARAGCRQIYFGIDTGSEIVWRNINKRLSRKKVLDVLGRTLQYMGVTASFIWGYPDESFAAFADTLTLSYEVSQLPRNGNPLVTQLHFLSPTRATPIYEAHHASLAFSEEVRLEICGSARLKQFAHLEDYETCMSLVRNDSALFAPFYHYRSEELERKWAVLRESESFYERFVGAALLAGEVDLPAVSLHSELVATAQREDDVGLSARAALPRLTNLHSDKRLRSTLERVARTCSAPTASSVATA